jgi:hypothetical protein
MTCDPRQHSGTDFVTVMKGEDIVRPTGSLQYLMGTALALHSPSDSKQGGQDDLRLTGTPYAHAGTEKTSVI